jgi:hypothetical protein
MASSLRAIRRRFATPRVLGPSILVLVAVAAGVALLAAGKPIRLSPDPADKISEDLAKPDAALAAASADMVAPPFGTPLALVADPRQLRELTIRGVADYEGAASEAAQIAAMRRIHAAANLGYGPARDLILANFSSGRVIRVAVPAPDAVRYAMDTFANDPRRTNSANRTFLPLAWYFAQRNELETFATHVIEAVRDDARLQSGKSLDQLLEALARVSGACQAIARTVAAPRSADYTRCPAALKMSVLMFVKSAGPVYRDDRSRRQALSLIEKRKGGQEREPAGNAASVPRLIPPSPGVRSAAEPPDFGR